MSWEDTETTHRATIGAGFVLLVGAAGDDEENNVRRLADKISPRKLLVTGAALTGSGFLLLAVPDAHTGYLWGFMPALLLMGIGMGVCQVPSRTSGRLRTSSKRW